MLSIRTARTSLALGLPLVVALSGCTAQVPSQSESVTTQASAIDCDDQVYTADHYVAVAPDVTLHVVESYTHASLAREHRRAILMLSGTLVSSTEFNLPSPYNGLERAAKAGYIGYAVDYEGYGQSTLPADGKIVTAPRLLGEMGQIIEWIRHTRRVPRVDLLGSSLGSSLAVELGGVNSPINRHHVGKLLLTSVVYKNVTPAFQAAFFNPAFEALLLSIPGGYIPTTADAYGPIVLFADPAAAAYVDADVPGVYAVGPTLAGFSLPIYPAQDGRAPAMQFLGDHDPITPPSDLAQFQAEYGGDASYSILTGSGHIPFYSSAKDTFWQQSFEFLERGGDCWDKGWGDGCGDDSDDSSERGAETSAPSSASPVVDSSMGRGCSSW